MNSSIIRHHAVAAATVLVLTTVGLSPALAASGRSFIRNAIEADNSEVELGKLAANKADDQRVKDFGNTLATDHGKAKDEAAQVARQLHARVPAGVTRDARREERKLQGMSGAAFDKEFVSYMIKDHKKDISEFERQAKSRDKATAELAQRQLPTLQKHLQIAQSLQSPQ